MITPHFSQYRMAWPFTFGDLPTIDTEAADPVWSVPGHFKTPPPEVCDLLTAATFDFNFELTASLFNTHYSESLPSNVSFSKTVTSGTWYASIYGVEETRNTADAWDTQVDLFEGYIDPTEDFTNISPFGFCGSRWVETQDEGPSVTDFYYTVSATMYAMTPTPAKNLSGEYYWRISPPLYLTVSRTHRLYGDVTSYSMNPGVSYLGVDHLGGPGVGEGGSVPAASISIATHF